MSSCDDTTAAIQDAWLGQRSNPVILALITNTMSKDTGRIYDGGTHYSLQLADYFSRLPPELIAMVSHYISLRDVLAMRSVCWAALHCVEKQFLEAFFTTRYHDDTPSSLDVLVCISQSPVLRKRLRCLELTVTYPYDFTSIPHQNTPDSGYCEPWARNIPAEIDNMHTCMHLLTTALGNLERSRIYPKLVFRPCTRAYRDIGSTPHNSDVISFALIVLGKTQYPVMDLDISYLGSWHSACASTYELANLPMPWYLRAPRWKYLTRLKFIMPKSPSPTLYDRYGVVDERRKDFAPLGVWLLSLCSLQQLIVSFYHNINVKNAATDCQQLQCWMANMKLRTLGIDFGSFEMKGLLDLLQSQPKLHSLQLWSVDLAGHGQWPQALRWMASHLRLKYVQLRNMTQGVNIYPTDRLSSNVSGRVVGRDHRVVFEDAQKVQQDLYRLADDLTSLPLQCRSG